jgi:predicted DNA-binding transcriptional regulator AlpA
VAPENLDTFKEEFRFFGRLVYKHYEAQWCSRLNVDEQVKRRVKMEEKLAISAKDVAELLDISERHVWALAHRELLPEPVRLGASVKFVRAEIEEWLRSGCPARKRWETMKRTKQ